jgi:epoxyqueuosine reductase
MGHLHPRPIIRILAQQEPSKTDTMENELVQEIRHICGNEDYEIGFASLEGLLGSLWLGYNYGISIIRKLDDEVINEITHGPTPDYYALYNAINNELNLKAMEVERLLNGHNIGAIAIKATVDDSELDDEYIRTLRYSFSHKMVATRAGLGWIGKTDLLVSHRFGPRIRLASVVATSAISEPGTPIDKSYCGECNLCVIKCPAQAATGTLWDSSTDRDVFYDPFKCRQYARKISAANLQKVISLCGICVSVCPKGKSRKAEAGKH